MTPLDAADRLPLYEHLWKGRMFAEWHWLQWNFDHVRRTRQETPFAALTLDALVRCDHVMPGFAVEMLDRLASFGGRDRNQDDYQAILQWLAELLVIHHLVIWPWAEPTSFEHEPTAVANGPNPEIVITTGEYRVGVEVKSPDLRRHREARRTNSWQLTARLDSGKDAVPTEGGVTFPRDNPLKDFLVSANKKFEGFRGDEKFHSALFVVWDDFINEPISALLSPASGLFTERSFHRSKSDDRMTYPAVDAVVLIRHQHQFVAGTQNLEPADERDDFLDYGATDRFPFNALVPCPDGRGLPEPIRDALQAVEPSEFLGAEYLPGETVMWIDG